MPEIRNPNLDSQGPGGSAPGGDNRSLILFALLALAVVMAFQFFKKPDSRQPGVSEPAGGTAKLAASGFRSGAGRNRSIRAGCRPRYSRIH